jgi:integrase
MIQAGVPLPVIQQRLGHKSIQTTIGLSLNPWTVGLC